MKNLIWILIGTALIAQACGGDPNIGQQGNEPVAREDTLSTPKGSAQTLSALQSDWLIQPGERIGLIPADADESIIVETYGQENVARRGVGIGERQTVQATVLFPDQPDELILLWKGDQMFQQIAEVRVHQENSRWHTPSGVKVGQSLSALEKINGKPFHFYGFEWDYAGLVDDWDGGRVSSAVEVYLIAEQPEALLPELLGEQKFPVSHPKAQAAELKVGSMVIMFAEEETLK